MKSPLALIVLALALDAPQVHAQQLADRARAVAPIGAVATEEPYRIGPEDILDISVWNNDSVNRIVPVRPDGKISLPLVSDVQAAGLTPVELRESLRRSLAPYIPSSEVSVVVREVHSLKVSVLGQVKLPGRYEIKSRATVLDAVALAGGFNDFASRSKLLIIRQSGTTTHRIVFNYSKFVTADQGEDCPTLMPGDLVVVQ